MAPLPTIRPQQGPIPAINPALAALRQPASEPTGAISLPQGPAPQMPTAIPTINNPQNDAYQRETGMLRNIAYPEPKPAAKGFWPKAGHILSTIGNIAGDVMVPNVMARVPGTQMYQQEQQGAASRQLNDLEKEHSAEGEQNALEGETQERTREMPQKMADEEGLQKATEANLESETENRGQPTTPELGTYRSLVKMGMSPSDALQEIERDKQMGVKPPNIAAKTLQLPGGEKVAGKVDSQGNLLLGDGTLAPKGTLLYQQPNYGEMVLPTKTATFIDPKTGLPMEKQWDTATQTFDKPLGLSASNAYGHEAAQAGAVERGGAGVIADLQANRDKVGTLGAWVAKYGLNTPIADPTLAGIQSRLSSFAALNPAMHGARGLHTMEHFEKIIGGLQQNPDASIAAIEGIMRTAEAVNPGLGAGGAQNGGTGDQPLGETSKPDGTYEMNGKHYRVQGGKVYAH